MQRDILIRGFIRTSNKIGCAWSKNLRIRRSELRICWKIWGDNESIQNIFKITLERPEYRYY